MIEIINAIWWTNSCLGEVGSIGAAVPVVNTHCIGKGCSGSDDGGERPEGEFHFFGVGGVRFVCADSDLSILGLFFNFNKRASFGNDSVLLIWDLI